MSARCAGCSETENGQEQEELRAAANKATMFQPEWPGAAGEVARRSRDGRSFIKPLYFLLAPTDIYFTKVGFTQHPSCLFNLIQNNKNPAPLARGGSAFRV